MLSAEAQRLFKAPSTPMPAMSKMPYDAAIMLRARRESCRCGYIARVCRTVANAYDRRIVMKRLEIGLRAAPEALRILSLSAPRLGRFQRCRKQHVYRSARPGVNAAARRCRARAVEYTRA